VLTHRLIEEGRAHRVLGGSLDLTCPVRLIHGMRDRDVPWQTSLRLARCLPGTDVTLTLSETGDHRLSGAEDLARLHGIIAALV
jgi:pimeloyl-ACP methyl ester carboxylesterase